MNELTFACPSCGQHIQCEKAYGGHVIHCPGCSAALRIPFSDTLPGELSVTKAELILDASATPTPNASAPAPAEARCLCPVCRSELRVPAGSANSPEPPVAVVIRRAIAPQPAEPAPSPPAEPHPAPAPAKPGTEREQQIAAAREANQVSTYPRMKPRLSYILSGEKPPPSDDAPAAAPADKQNEDGADDGSKTLAE